MYEKQKHIINIIKEPAVRYRKAYEGISKSDFLAIVATTGMNLTAFSKLLPVSKRTLEKIKDEELISAPVSDRILEIAALYEYGKEVFGEREAFQAWLETDLLALAHKKPRDFMDNSSGLTMIKDLLGRIEHGVYS
ncbi:MAG: antitoxin Xre/MbcA/ParS toxin-binding domain-containing protein [Reichenbachiella sp.]|uniref:type II RES/Xre toxin-antitoxin system antitoxin n=1 Tax=Reichenbachiella sp. TaxID=2184521 RepID=UPI00326788C0